MSLEMQLKLNQRLELRQELLLQLQALTLEFGDFITFEDDSDSDLLAASFPFLIVHEVGHPLYEKDLLVIPAIALDPEVEKQLEDNSDLFGNYMHNAVELGIDRGAILIGEKKCGYSLQEMADSHAAITQRVLRDMLYEEKLDPEYSMLARLDSALRQHAAVVNRKLNIEELRRQPARYIQKSTPHLKDLYETLVTAYTDIYCGTNIVEKP